MAPKDVDVDFNREAKVKLFNKHLDSIRRIVLVQFTRAYRKTSTNVLKVLAGIPPSHCGQSYVPQFPDFGDALQGQITNFIRTSEIPPEKNNRANW
ncbi:hypothetical protein AVEN_124043-1 [Araneus ventricosus]|uniref:Uncharacterized protein n=1 Tax=Araneus ventricosus TaxID=182803 RepID=A0A4Y2VES1_ARAVE|nr:hypothetical protein AVEN_124043-1 [Araneus ventricosus]